MVRKRSAANGEGTIFAVKRGPHKGKYGAALTLGRRSDGKLDRIQKLFRSRLEADAWLQEKKRERDRGAPLIVEKATVEQYIELWLENVVRIDRSPATYENYSSIARNHILPELGAIPLSKLRAVHVQKLKSALRSGGTSPSTARHALTILRAALARAKRWNLVDENAAALVELPPASAREARTLDRDAGLRFIQATRSDRLFALYALDLFLGLRRGEILGLRWCDVDLEAGRISINGALQRVRGALTRREPKTASSRREIALPRVVVSILEAHRSRQLAEREARRLDRRWTDTDYVFTTTLGRPIEPGKLSARFRELRAELDLPSGMHFHDLRHSVATLLLEEGLDIKMISRLLGHADTKITRDIYIRYTDRLRQQTADKIDELFEEAGEPEEEAGEDDPPADVDIHHEAG